MSKKKEDKKDLNTKEKLFCKYYTKVWDETFCNATKSYMKVFKNVSYDSARVKWSQLLANVNILDYINKILDWLEVSEPIADRELAKLILQDEEKGVKLQALKHFNDLKVRIEKARQKALNDNDITKDVITVKLPE